MCTQTTDFVLETKGHCFLCLHPVLPKSHHVKVEPEEKEMRTLCSLKYLTRFLKMDMRIVFNEGSAISVKLLTNVQNSELKVELCNECAILSESFSETYRHLEKIKMELGSRLDQICQKIMKGKKNTVIEEITKLDETETNISDGFLGELEIVEALRNEAYDKCFSKLKESCPRIRVQKLTSHDIAQQKTRNESNDLYKMGSENCEDYPTYLPMTANNVKVESTDPTSDESGNDKFDDHHPSSDFDNEDTQQLQLQDAKVEVNHDESRVDRKRRQDANSYIVINPSKLPKEVMKPKKNIETGRFHCGRCPKIFTSCLIYQRDFKSSHSKERYKCKRCGMVFKHTTSYYNHNRAVHMGLRVGFECNNCNGKFGSAPRLKRHLQITKCGKGITPAPKMYPCRICGNRFAFSRNLPRHMREVHHQQP